MESARIVADRLIERMAEEEEGGAPRLSFDELYRLIEKALVENDAYDVAKSLVICRSSDGGSTTVDHMVEQIRLIRRSGAGCSMECIKNRSCSKESIPFLANRF